jgi:hypothetical protein
MRAMTILKKLFSYALSISLWFFTGCSGGDEPKPFDCNTSDLDLSVSIDSNPTTCVANDGSITVVAIGGSEPYQYKIGAGSFGSSNIFSGLGAGTFTITVRDKNGCTVEISESLELPGENSLSATTTIVADTECVTNNGSITVNASGGTGPYQYKLGTGAFVDTEVFNGLSSGGKTITVKDAASCIFTLNVTVPSGDTGITYEGEILAIFIAKCQFAGCHPDNGNWFDYTTAKNSAATIKTLTGNGSMPKSPQPGGALTASEKALIACWVDDGAPQN